MCMYVCDCVCTVCVMGGRVQCVCVCGGGGSGGACLILVLKNRLLTTPPPLLFLPPFTAQDVPAGPDHAFTYIPDTRVD